MTSLPVKQMNDDTLISVRGAKKYFPVTEGWFNRQVATIKAVDDITFDIRRGETFGLVGESGSGKSSIARLILRAYDLTDGEILFRRASGDVVDITTLGDREMREIRREMQMIFQDPYSSLNPRMTLLDLVGEPMVIHGLGTPAEIKDRVSELLGLVGLRPEYVMRYPHAFSGGQRQRIGIARALALNPSFIAADEAVSALDVSVAAQNINLMQDLQEKLGLTYLFITHDLGMVEHISDRVGVMYLGRLMEVGQTEDLFAKPKHPYTEALLAAVPQPDPRGNRARKRVPLKGEIADAMNIPSGCPFHPRCAYADDKCRAETPELRKFEGGRQVRCHYADSLDLVGVAAQ
jgi:oligopeptide/dipeptide ABC transporter ATP-binding protein